jgi:hypothetical protein
VTLLKSGLKLIKVSKNSIKENIMIKKLSANKGSVVNGARSEKLDQNE